MRLLLTIAVLLTIAATPLATRAADPYLNRPAPEITGERWINSAPLSMSALKGRVVLVEFWTYG